jgi:hypothetical protein
VAVNHHFVLSVYEPSYEFVSGAYTVEVFARLAGKPKPQRLQGVEITVTEEHTTAPQRREDVLFDLNPEGDAYSGHARPRPPSDLGEA